MNKFDLSWLKIKKIVLDSTILDTFFPKKDDENERRKKRIEQIIKDVYGDLPIDKTDLECYTFINKRFTKRE